MMERHLLLTVRFHGDGQGTARFHGMGQGGREWPPAPARLFQALVAGIARGGKLPEELVPALQWLETLSAPVIAAPSCKSGQSLSLFVPNNDADSLNDPRDVGSIRTKKLVHPSLFPAEAEFLYAWPFSDDEEKAGFILASAKELYQLGRGIDPAWATGEVLDSVALDARLERYPGVIYRPRTEDAGTRLPCPVSGSLDSLIRRHASIRLRTEGDGRKARTFFANAPKPVFRTVAYGPVSRMALFELRDRLEDKPWPWRQDKIVSLVEALRDAAVARLQEALPEYQDRIETALVGSKEHPTPISDRVRILPLPSIGSPHADRRIRRFLLEIPSGAYLPTEDIEWAFSGLEWSRAAGGGPIPFVVVRSEDWGMFQKHYQKPQYRWRSVTPVALPESAMRRRIEPSRLREEAKGGQERILEEQRAVAAVHHALRHAGVHGIAVDVRLQREPFEAKGQRAESFAEGTRFAKERLWHVEITFDRPVSGPLVIGDGRFLGLGLMAPVKLDPEFQVFAIESGLERDANPLQVAQALRRAVIARIQDVLGERTDIPAFFTGHERNGDPLRKGRKAHLAFAADIQKGCLWIIPPHRLEGRKATWDERNNLKKLDEAVTDLRDLRAGAFGRLQLSRRMVSQDVDPLLAPSQSWVSATEYEPTRFAKKMKPEEVIVQDIRTEFLRRKMTVPEAIEILEVHEGPKGGLRAKVRLRFKTAVRGPILLGRTCHSGGGLFRSVPDIPNRSTPPRQTPEGAGA